MSAIPDLPANRLAETARLACRNMSISIGVLLLGAIALLSMLGPMIYQVDPNAVSPLIVQGTFVFGSAVMVETILSFFGAGTPSSIPTWGNIIADGRSHFQIYPHRRRGPGPRPSGDHMREINERRLRYFCHVIQYGSFRRAAEELNTAPSVIMRQVQLLEQEIGVKLFDRDVSDRRPTDAAQFLLDDWHSSRSLMEVLGERIR